MICPECKKDGKHKVLQTDDSDFLEFKRRCRQCEFCHAKFETVEKATGHAYHKRRRTDPAQLELVIDSIQQSRDLSNEKHRRLRKVTDELRGIFNAAQEG